VPDPGLALDRETTGGRPSQAPLFLRACRGEPVERTPVWIMRQAGRYLPEYRALRERYDFLTSCRTPELACEITLQPVKRLDVDAAILFSDILIPLPGMGVEVTFTPGPHLAHPIREGSAIRELRVPDPHESTGFVLEAIRLLRSELAHRVPLIGFAGAPFTMAAYLVEGGSTRSFAALKSLLFGSPQLGHQLLDKCTETIARYLSAQVRAGAQAAMLFDTWAGQLAPADVQTFVLPSVRRVITAVRAAAEAHGEPALPIIYYAGDASGWLEGCSSTGADVVGIDWRIPLDVARARLGPAIAVQGNLDPGVLLGSSQVIQRQVARVLDEARGGPGRGAACGHIFNLGHGILPDTPPDHARLLVETVRDLTEGF
jgi:uroporphyrinogen decarboxylase